MKSTLISKLAERWPLAAEALAGLICGLFILAGSLISVHRFWQYEIWYYDFGIFDQAIRSAAAFRPPIIEHFVVEDKWIWADHFHPGIFLLSPIYWFTDKSEAILVAQAVVIGISAYVLFRIALTKLKSHFLSLMVLLSYVFFVGLQNAVLTEFHELALVTLPLMLCYWAIINNKKKTFLITFASILLFKESLFALGIGLSFFVFWYRKEWRKLAILTSMYSVLWGLFAIKIVIPYFSGKSEYQYAPPVHSLAEAIPRLYTPFIKVSTVFNLFWSFFFLPVAYLPTLPIIGINLLGRFLSEGSTRWDLGLHYNAELAPTLAVSVILILAILLKKLPKKVVYLIAVLMVLNSLFLYHVKFRRPFALAYNRAFYAHTQDFKFLNDLMVAVPPGKTVMTQNNLAARFTDRKVKMIRANYETYKPELIVLDMRAGQNPNNFLFAGDQNQFFADVKADVKYEILYQSHDQYIFQRKAE